MIFHLYKLYATYRKRHLDTGKVYVGRTSGRVKFVGFLTGVKIVDKRDQHHHKNKDGYGKTVIDKFSTDKEAIRGREQQLIEQYKNKGTSGNIYNGISSRNKKKSNYIATALRIFGDAIIILLLWHVFVNHLF